MVQCTVGIWLVRLLFPHGEMLEYTPLCLGTWTVSGEGGGGKTQKEEQGWASVSPTYHVEQIGLIQCYE